MADAVLVVAFLPAKVFKGFVLVTRFKHQRQTGNRNWQARPILLLQILDSAKRREAWAKRQKVFADLTLRFFTHI